MIEVYPGTAYHAVVPLVTGDRVPLQQVIKGATFSFSIPRSPGSAIGERLLNSAQKLASGRGRL